MKKLVLTSVLTVVMALTASTAQAAVMYDGVSYAQDFNALPIADNSNFDWAQDETLPGWYFDTSGKKLADTDDGRSLVVASDVGRTSTDRLLSLATDTDSTNAAMGMRGVGWQTAPDGGAFAVRLRNDSGAEITELSVGFTVQQWMRDAAAGTMSFYYYEAGDLATLRGTDGDDVDIDSVGTLVSALSYMAPHTGEAAMLDGTLAANSSVLVENITGLSWAAGEDLWLAWDKPTADSVLAIDDLHITPEPATMSLLGLGGLVALRRRRSR